MNEPITWGDYLLVELWIPLAVTLLVAVCLAVKLAVDARARRRATDAEFTSATPRGEEP